MVLLFYYGGSFNRNGLEDMLVENASFSMIDGAGFGIVITGCETTTATVIEKWAGPVLEFLKDEEAVGSDATVDTFFDKIQVLTTTGGRTDLAFVISKQGSGMVNIGRLAMVRLGMPDCSWIEDFVVNYRDQYDINLTPCGVDPSQHNAECPMCDNFDQ